MEPTVTIPARLALLVARYLAVQREISLAAGHGRQTNFVEAWQEELINAVADQCTTEEFEAAAVAVRLEESTY